MSIKLELHLKGADANEDTLRDLINWLEQEDIPDIRIQKPETPPVEGQMGADDILAIVGIILTIPAAILATKQLIDSIAKWLETRNHDVSFKTDIKDANNDIKQKIDALLEKIRQKRNTKRHDNQ